MLCLVESCCVQCNHVMSSRIKLCSVQAYYFQNNHVVFSRIMLHMFSSIMLCSVMPCLCSVEPTIARACALWSKYADLTFSEAGSGTPDLEIRFESGTIDT